MSARDHFGDRGGPGIWMLGAFAVGSLLFGSLFGMRGRA